ncbi:protein of unknown function [Micropruina glycogenica]|uniref:Uncharacterized protein n=1 Tax=Micropruina glycogenica TaxID=75385 RepID=A0A2N9JG69_9ACTN|nr:protein of unknown function [Micropruina glycogenica]
MIPGRDGVCSNPRNQWQPDEGEPRDPASAGMTALPSRAGIRRDDGAPVTRRHPPG